MGNSRLTIVNVRLPLADERLYYTLRAEGGRWTEVAAQDGYLERSEPYAPFDAEGAVRAECLDAEGKVALPGFADVHMHLDKAFSLPKVGNVSGTLGEAIANYAASAGTFSKEEILSRIMKTALQAVSYGTSAIRTHLDFHAAAGRRVALQSVEAALEAKERLAPYLELQIFPMFSYRSSTASDVELFEEALRMGVTGVGGAPHIADEPERNIDLIFRLAEKFDRPIDLHTDETDDPEMKTVLYIADKTTASGYGGRVTVDHLCSLASMPPAEAASVIARMAEAKLSAVTLPAANLYLQGRGDSAAVRRGVTRVKELAAAGIPIATASDNVHDPFHPFGRGDMLQIALITAYGAHMGAPSDLRRLLRMATEIPASIMGLRGYGIAAGNAADLVLLDAVTPDELFTKLPDRRWIYRAGRWLKFAPPEAGWEVPELGEQWTAYRRYGL